MKGFIYLIRSFKTQKGYLGSSANPSKRIDSHNRGYTESTKKDRPWVYELVINVGTIEDAREIEKYIKTRKEKLNIKNIVRALFNYYFRG